MLYTMKNLNFTAFDVETPTSKNDSICQIGLAIVEDGEIVKQLSLLVQPPYNYYDQHHMSFHHIRPDMTFCEPTFDLIWNEIAPYMENRVLVAHNASFDFNVLQKVAQKYNIDLSNVNPPICTCQANNRAGLKDCCEAYNIDLNHHHDACCDAVACATLYIKMHLEGPKNIEKSKSTKGGAKFQGDKKINHDNLIPDLSNADPTNPFFGKKIVITGEFPIERNLIAATLKNMGADVDTSITRKTKYVLVGNAPGPSKMTQIKDFQQNGYNIHIISFEEFIKATAGNSLSYLEYWDGKNLRLNIEHLEKLEISLPINGKNIFGGIEIFVDPLVNGDKLSFNQLFGYLGAFANGNLDDATHILLSDSTWYAIQAGESNPTKEYIENYYNKGKSIKFDYALISESDFIDYYKTRVHILKDEVVTNTFVNYLESIDEVLDEDDTSLGYLFSQFLEID